MVHALELNQSGQAHGDHQTPEHTHEHIFYPHGPLLVVQTNGNTKQGKHQKYRRHGDHQSPQSQPTAHRNGGGSQGGNKVHAIVVGHLGSPQQLKGSRRADGSHQRRQPDGVQEKEDYKKQGRQYHGHDNPCQQVIHLQTGGNGPGRPRWPCAAPPWRSRATARR